MAGNMSYLTEYKEINRGYVAFGGNPKGGKITSKGKFDGKTDEGFFVGYSLNSKAFRVFNGRTKIVEENLHIRFSENTPNIVGSGTNWLFDINLLTKSINYKPVVAGNQPNGNVGTKACDDAESKSSQDDGFQPSSDDENKVDEDPRLESECKVQEKEDNVNNTNNINVAGINRVNVVGAITNNELSFDPEMPALEDINTFNFSSDHEDGDEMADMNNLDTTIKVSHTPTTRIHKDHPIDQVIGDLHSTTQTRNMSKNLEEHGLVTTVHQRTNHKDLQNCLFACFLSQEVPIKKYSFIEVKNESTPMETQKPLLKDEDGEEVDVHMYRLMIGSLMYLTSSRLDIMFTVCGCARYQVNPKVSHLHVVKMIFRDLQLEDAEGVDCLPNADIFEQLTLMGKPRRKVTKVPQPNDPTEHVADEAVNEETDDSLERAATTATSLDAKQDRGNIFKTQSKATPNEPVVNTPPGETIKTTQALKIDSLKRRVKKLKRRNRSRTHGLKRLYKVRLSARVESSENEGLGKEDASKQGRIADIDANKDIYLVSVHNDKYMFDVNDLDGDEVIVKSVDVVEQAKEFKDKGKGKIVKPKHVKKLSKKDQLMLNEELAFKIQAKEEEKERLAREKAQKIKEVNIAWDDVKAKTDADYELAQRLQVEEQKELNDAEKEKLFI
nr:ribonuclease H-like domain-containing protein [Tanacetum cinerariifolium]